MLNIHFDGAWINPEETGSWGYVIRDAETGKTIHKDSHILVNPRGSCNYAEYTGLLKALEYLSQNGLYCEDINIYGDSLLVIRQMQHRWRIKNGLYTEQAKKTLGIAEKFQRITYNWIPRAYNTEADLLTEKEMGKVGLFPNKHSHHKKKKRKHKKKHRRNKEKLYRSIKEVPKWVKNPCIITYRAQDV